MPKKMKTQVVSPVNEDGRPIRRKGMEGYENDDDDDDDAGRGGNGHVAAGAVDDANELTPLSKKYRRKKHDSTWKIMPHRYCSRLRSSWIFRYETYK
jgi:hypothetical protein